jgi:hypothetical protein
MVEAQQETSETRFFRSPDFPATEFFLHLSEGTKFFCDKDFEKAISEWEEAATMRPDYDSTMRIVGSVFYKGKGSLDDFPLVGLFYALSSNFQTGVAIIHNGHAHKEVYFKEGWIVFARTNKSEERIGNLLVKRKLVSQSHIDKMVVEAKKKGEKLGNFLVENGLLLKKELREVLDLQVKEILCDLLSWKEGEFYFVEREVDDGDVVVNYTPLDIALFAARTALDFSAFRKMVPHNQVIFHIPPYIESAKAKIGEELDANENFIFSLIDGKRNIDQLIKFSGDDEMFTISILHRLLLMGFIEKAKDSGVVYDDTEFKEFSQYLKTLLEVFRLVIDELKKELGAMAEEVLNKAKGSLKEDYGRIFYGISPEGDIATDTNKILKNIAVNYPNPSARLIFIDGFHGLLHKILLEMRQILGIPLTKKVVMEVEKVRGEVIKFCADSPARNKVLDALGKLVTNFSG